MLATETLFHLRRQERGAKKIPEDMQLFDFPSEEAKPNENTKTKNNSTKQLIAFGRDVILQREPA